MRVNIAEMEKNGSALETTMLRTEEGREMDMQPGKKLPQFTAAISATLAAAAAGTCLTWTSPALPMLPFTEQEGSWIGSMLSLGAVPGAAAAGTMTQIFGRKPAIAALALPFIISYIIIGLSQNLWAIYVARLIAGVGLGGVVVAVPIYVAEIAEDSVRGTLGSIMQIMFNLGILYVYSIGAAENYAALAWSSAAVGIAFFIIFIFMPETPQYLLSKGHRDDALLALRWLRGRQDTAAELAVMVENVERDAEERRRSSFREMLTKPAMRRALVLSVGLVTIQQLSGINVVFFYTQGIFEAAGSSMMPSTCSIVVGVVMLVFSPVAALLADRAGRRLLLLASSIIMAISLTSLGGYFQAKSSYGNDAVSGIAWLPLASVISYMCAYLLGFGPLPWAVMAEVLPPGAKGTTGALVSACCWIESFVMTKCFQDIVDGLGTAAAFFTFAVFSIIGAAFVFFLLPETKAKSLEQIQRELAVGFRAREAVAST